MFTVLVADLTQHGRLAVAQTALRIRAARMKSQPVGGESGLGMSPSSLSLRLLPPGTDLRHAH